MIFVREHVLEHALELLCHGIQGIVVEPVSLVSKPVTGDHGETEALRFVELFTEIGPHTPSPERIASGLGQRLLGRASTRTFNKVRLSTTQKLPSTAGDIGSLMSMTFSPAEPSAR